MLSLIDRLWVVMVLLLSIAGCASRYVERTPAAAAIHYCPGADRITDPDPSALAGNYDLMLHVTNQQERTVDGLLALRATRDLAPDTAAAVIQTVGRAQLIGWIDGLDGQSTSFRFSVDPASRLVSDPGVVGIWGGGAYPLTLSVGGWGGARGRALVGRHTCWQ